MTESTCPSGRCQEGSLLLGVVNADQSVGFIHPAIPLDEEFVERAGTAPLRRFRFAEPCATSRCAQWTGERCGVIDEVLAEAPGQPLGAPLPFCSIRRTCRWFGQSGRAACAVCRFVVTEEALLEEATTTTAP
jgi:hypothetical protein